MRPICNTSEIHRDAHQKSRQISIATFALAPQARTGSGPLRDRDSWGRAERLELSAGKTKCNGCEDARSHRSRHPQAGRLRLAPWHQTHGGRHHEWQLWPHVFFRLAQAPPGTGISRRALHRGELRWGYVTQTYRKWQRSFSLARGLCCSVSSGCGGGLASAKHWYSGRIDPPKFRSVLSRIGLLVSADTGWFGGVITL